MLSQPPVIGYQEVKGLGHEAEVRNEWSCSFFLPYAYISCIGTVPLQECDRLSSNTSRLVQTRVCHGYI